MTNLFVLGSEIVLSLGLAILFLWQLEGFGYLAYKFIKLLDKKLKLTSKTNLDEKPSSIILILIGSVFFTLTFFTLGLLSLLSKPLVVILSILPATLALIIFRRWKKFNLKTIKQSIKDNVWINLSAIGFFLFLFPFAFRPITSFDAIWYHLTIPKFWLQEGNILVETVHLRYSTQPSMTFFWNMWHLSWPLDLPLTGLAINTFQLLIVTCALAWVVKIGKDTFQWKAPTQFLAIFILGISVATLKWYGTAYNDLIGLIFGLTAALYAHKILLKKEIAWSSYCMVWLLIIGAATVKFFFTLFAAAIAVYFLLQSYKKLSFSRNKLLTVIATILVMFVFLYLPWLIRAYVETGRPLDPVGSPGLNADSYKLAGSGNFLTHWNGFIFERLYINLPHILFTMFTPFFGLGILSIVSNKNREKIQDLWFLATISFLTLYLIVIYNDDRYYFPSAALLIFLGINFLDSIYWKHLSIFAKSATAFVLLLITGLTLWWDLYQMIHVKNDIYLISGQNHNQYLESKIGESKHEYFPSNNSPKPIDLSPDEKIFVGGINNTGYIPNPTLDPNAQFRKFENVHNLEDFANLLESHKIRYLLVSTDFQKTCNLINLGQDPECALENDR